MHCRVVRCRIGSSGKEGRSRCRCARMPRVRKRGFAARENMTGPRRIGIFGGSFDPIHTAHLLLAEQACEVLGLERVIFVPARLPPHKDCATLASARDRLKMVRLAVADNPRLAVSDIELRREGPSYTVDTILAMRRRFGKGAELFFLIGGDTVAELPTWRDIGRLVELCTVVPLSRPGARAAQVSALTSALGRKEARGILSRTIRMPLLGISATDIRARASEGRSIRYLVPSAVEEYIRRKRLYGSATKPITAPSRPRRCSEATSRRSSGPRRRGRA